MPWAEVLADHASDADYRKNIDPNEGPRHYIDIDNYDEFVNTGRIPQTLDSVIMLYGEYFVYDQGVLPWATLRTFDSLRLCFEQERWDDAVLFASDLGHYVADGHMPLHITRNYNGQFTNNEGIHSRYESTMINAYISQISYAGMPITEIDDVPQYVFNYLYNNYQYVDSVLLADDYAKSESGGSTHSSTYKQALWDYSSGFTTTMFENASHALTELIYTAWKEAGSPQMGSSDVPEVFRNRSFSLDQNIPNPFTGSTTIRFSTTKTTHVNLKVMNQLGQTVEVLLDGTIEPGDHSIEWNAGNNAEGVYLLVMQTDAGRMVKKMALH